VTWLISRRFDLAVFVAPAAVALTLVAFGESIAPGGELPLSFWVVAVMLVDVAHVWSTIYRTYLDPRELARHRVRYLLVPIACWGIGAVLYSRSSATFWTALAYLAVIHFVRQQYGWVALYQRREPGLHRVDLILDRAAIYTATIIPILWWHAHLPRQFDWFLPGDFVAGLIPGSVDRILFAIYVAVFAAFIARQIIRRIHEGVWRTGKILLIATTAACWGVGIVATNTDFAFTITNVLIHGIPYMAIIWVYGRRTNYPEGSILARIYAPRISSALFFYGALVLIAYAEELGWDRLLWDDHETIFPLPAIELSNETLALIVPLLALPQATHYVLDAFIWRRKEQVN
jgi:hypothetical protein